MSAANVTESDILGMVCDGVDPAWRASANGYYTLFTADPTDTGSLASECNDASFARVAAVKATAWTGSGTSSRANAAQVNWPTLVGSGSPLTHWAWVSSASGATAFMVSGALTTPVPWSPGVKPVAEIGTLQMNAD